MATYHLTNYDDEWWRTISIVTVDGEPHAYQQKCIVGRPYRESERSGEKSYITMIPVETEDHRLIPISETVSEESKQDLTDRFMTLPDES